MERVLSLCVGSVAVGTVGLLILLKVVQRLRHKQNVQDKVVVITGASSGLGKGYSNSHNNAVLSMTFDLISFHWLFVLHHSASVVFFRMCTTVPRCRGPANPVRTGPEETPGGC